MPWVDTVVDGIWSKNFAKMSPKQRDKSAREIVNSFSYGCALVSVSPIPFSDAFIMLPFQSMMVMSVGHIYGRKVTKADAKDLVMELGATVGLGMLARQGIKAVLPVFGPMLTIPAAFAANWAIGRVAMEHFKTPGTARDQLKKVYATAKKEAESLFSKAALDEFRKKAAAPNKKRSRKKA
jgi:uncharacterized protein (DUF697 family)